MRKFSHIILSILLPAVCACSKQDAGYDVPSTELKFEVSASDAPTKAAKIDLDTLRANGFQVYANVHEPEARSTTSLMNAQQINYSAGKWTYEPIKYWPNTAGATVDFYAAYTDGSDNVRILYDWYNMPQTTFYVNSVVSKQTDMLWAAPILGAKKEDYSSTPVKFTFKHSLTAFFFRIKLDSEIAGTDVRVKSLALTGFFAPKAYVIPDETDFYRAYSLQGDWQERTYTLNASGDQEITSEAATGPLTATAVNLTGKKGYIMVLPFNYQEYTVSLCYEVTRGTQTIAHTVSYTETGADLKQGIICNTLLNLNLDKMGGGSITHTSTIQDWKDIIVEQEELKID